jgi:hypothetical protein
VSWAEELGQDGRQWPRPSRWSVPAPRRRRPTGVSGVITRTYVIVEDTELTGNVTCEVANATPCFSFGAAGVQLRLNGFSITGRADAITGCGGTSVNGGAGIITVRENVVVGNPAIQTGNTRPDPQSVDILNMAPTGQTTFDRNVCVTSVNAPCPVVSRDRP